MAFLKKLLLHSGSYCLDGGTARLEANDEAGQPHIVMLARFGPGNAATPLVLNLFNALLPSNVTLTPDGGEVDAVPFLLAPLEFFYVHHQWTEFRYGPIDLHVGYANLGGLTVVTLNGVPWQMLVFGPREQFLGAVTLALSDNSELTFLLSGVLGQIVGVEPA